MCRLVILTEVRNVRIQFDENLKFGEQTDSVVEEKRFPAVTCLRKLNLY